MIRTAKNVSTSFIRAIFSIFQLVKKNKAKTNFEGQCFFKMPHTYLKRQNLKIKCTLRHVYIYDTCFKETCGAVSFILFQILIFV